MTRDHASDPADAASAACEPSTAHVVDACLRLGLEPRVAPPGLRPVGSAARLSGRVLPVRHSGTLDVVFEALARSRPGDVLVIDNGGRLDEGCIGDLIAIEAGAWSLAGIVVWGAHRDTSEIAALGLPVLSYGAFPVGPRRLDPRPDDALARAYVGGIAVDADDGVVADRDGAVFVALRHLGAVVATALEIRRSERAQARRVAAGERLYDQFRVDAFLRARGDEPELTFGGFLKRIGGVLGE